MASKLFNKIAVIGVGLLGGSVLLAARRSQVASTYSGWDINSKSVLKASSKIGFQSGTLEEVVSNADLVVLCTPVEVMKQTVKKILPYLSKKTIVTDVGSVKTQVHHQLAPLLKGKATWIPSHPMAGSDKSGWEYSSENLFDNASIIITPKAKDKKSLPLIKLAKFWKILGGNLFYLTPEEHDYRIARISHLPHLIAYNLVELVDLKTMQLAGKGFKDTTRVAKSSGYLWEGILVNNRKEVLKALKDFEKIVKRSRAYLENKSSKNLLAFLKKNEHKRKKIN